MRLDNPVKQKNKRNRKIRKVFTSTPHFLNIISIQVLAVKCKFKIDYFHFFYEYHIIRKEIIRPVGLNTYTYRCR